MGTYSIAPEPTLDWKENNKKISYYLLNIHPTRSGDLDQNAVETQHSMQGDWTLQ